MRKTLPKGPSRPPVVLVHGLAQNRYTWHLSGRSLANWLAVRGWDVWNLELRGHGRSRHKEQHDERFDDYAQDVLAVARALDGQAFFMGHSLGGAAIYAAAALGAPMRGMIGVGAVFSFAQHQIWLRNLARLTLAAERALPTRRLVVKTRVFGEMLAKLYGLSDSAAYTLPISGWWPGSMESELLSERLGHGFDWTSIQVWLDMSRWAVSGRFDPYQEPFSVCGTPLLVLAGDEDHLCPPGDARVPFDLAQWEDKQYRLFDHYSDGQHFGHVDLVLGRHAPSMVWPLLHDWMAARS
ncbi:MAG: alpha/beta fold hydrolase [Myxococcota bacterium]|nr:alpha/beta fold hydrolase [Myxococcota bacterium]